ncbi:MAG TPA: serine hydrolase, partial [Gammaproteobacteria bacterium]
MTHDPGAVRVDPRTLERHLIRVRPLDTQYGYDNMGLGLLGYLLGEVDGSSFARVLEKTVAAPLGLDDTTVGIPDRQLERLAACHTWGPRHESPPSACNRNGVHRLSEAACRSVGRRARRHAGRLHE